jgi:hypothetical protein
MTTQQQKLDAALSVVADSILHGWTVNAKVDYIRQILPDHYGVKESKQKGNVHCTSLVGITDNEDWFYFLAAIRQRFSDFLEVDHNTCHNHVDFTIYFKEQNT